jgi:DNA-binding protein YbaB
MRIFRAFAFAHLLPGIGSAIVTHFPRTLTAALVSAAVLCGGASGDAYAAPKYFIKIRDTELAPGVDAQAAKNLSAAASTAGSAADGIPDGGSASSDAAAKAGKPPIGEMVKSVLVESLRKQADVTLTLESPIADTEAVKAECKRKGLRSFEFAVRVLRLDRSVKPPAAGKRFRLLEQNVKLSVVGTTYPEGLLAVGGDGESTIQIEIGERVTPGQEREVLEEAVKDAVEQAVKQGMIKLSQPRNKPTSEKRKR